MATKGTIYNNAKPIIGNINDTEFFDIKSKAAEKGAFLLFGQGFTITSQDKVVQNYLSDLKEKNQMDDLMLQVARDTNYYGRTILTIDKPKSGDFIFSYANNELFQNVAKFECNEFGAKLLKRKVVGVQVYFIYEEWTINEVRRSISVEAKDGTMSGITNFSELPAELQIPLYERHNLGFVPFIEITNKPSRNLLYTAASYSQYLQDDYEVRYMPEHINNGLRQWYKEEVKGGARVFATLTEQQVNKLRNQGSNLPLDDYIINTNPMPNQSKPVEVQPASYNDQPWANAMKVKCNLYFIGCGLSPIFPEVAAPTEAESLLSRDLDITTTKAKRRRYQIKLMDLFAKVLVYKGMAADIKSAKEMFSVEIKENVVYNRLQLTDFLVSNINSKLMSRSEAILMARDLDNLEQAEEIKAQIDKAYEDETRTEISLMGEQEQATNDILAPGSLAPGKDARPVDAEE